MSRLFILSLMGLWTISCGKQPGKPGVEIRFQLPATLAKGSARYQRFLKRVTVLDLKVETKSGKQSKENYPPQAWEGLTLPDVGFPQGEDDALTVRAEVWDRQSDGLARSQPVLVGSGKLHAKDLERDRITALRIKLSLQVTAADFD